MNCQDCSYFGRLDGDAHNKGYCYGTPPTPLPNGSQIRATVKGTDRRCHFFLALPVGTSPVVITKTQPDTVGAALKAARKEKSK
jgi:hypothetical protein